jgi:spore maturation protein CgeB
MKILCCFSKYIYGDIDKGYSYEYLNYFLALKKIYPDTEIFDTSIIFNNLNNNNITDEITTTVRNLKPKITFFSLYKYEYDPIKIKNLQKYTSTIAIFMDDIWRLKHSYYWAKYFSYVTTTDIYGVERFRSKNLNNAFFFPFGVNSEIYFHSPNIKKKYDISFIGSWHPHREWILNKLIQKGYNVYIAGSNWDKSVISFKEMINIFNKSNINLNLSNSAQWNVNYFFSSLNSFKNSIFTPKKREQLKARNFEIGSTKNFVISYFFKQHKYFFKPNHELVEFRNINELDYFCKFYLNNPDIRDKISNNLQSKIYKNFKYENLLKNLINKILK